MKKGFKECPFCANEIREKAVKCQYCKEFLEEKKGENDKKESSSLKEADVNVKMDSFSNEQEKKSSECIDKKKEITGQLKWRHRVCALILDLIITCTIVGAIINIALILGEKKTTLGYIIMGIEVVNIWGGKPSWWQSALRFLLFYPIFFFYLFVVVDVLSFLFFDYRYRYYIFYNLGYYGFWVAIIILSINFIEIFSKSPTFMDEWIGIKRIKQQK